jgi:hypothetical protein
MASHLVDTPLHGRLLIRPQAGRTVVFPSWMQHFVHPNASDTDRITVAFNIIIKTAGDLGSADGVD